MNRTALVVGLLLLLIAVPAGIRLAGKGGHSDPGRETRENGSKGDRRAISPKAAASRLRSLHRKSESDAKPSYDDIVALARHLTDDDLQALLESVGMQEVESIHGWLRCALWSEWARRDPPAALAGMAEAGKFENSDKHASCQVFYSVYRGWAEVDLPAAYQVLRAWAIENSKGGQRQRHYEMDPMGAHAATEEIFRMLAERDPEQAWELLPKSYNDLSIQHAMTGLLRGLTREEVASYVARWQETIWEGDEAARSYEAYRTQSSAERTGHTSIKILIPPEERIAVINGAALAQHGLDGAISWLRGNGPGRPEAREARVTAMMREWAANDPGTALGLIDDPRYQEYRRAIGQGVMRGDPIRTPSVVVALAPEEALPMLQGATLLMPKDTNPYFPRPGATNRIPDREGHYEALLDAVRAGNFPTHREQELLLNVHRAFSDDLPRARTAAETQGPSS